MSAESEEPHPAQLGDSEFESVRRERDPLRRAQRALDLQVIYQQRAVELSRLRRASIEEAYRRGLSYKEIAEQLGVTRGRITQIRKNAPAAERAFFGVGPVTVAIPQRLGVAGRERPVVAVEDSATAELIENLLSSLSLASTGQRHYLGPFSAVAPTGDTVVICGPKIAPIAASLLDSDPYLSMVEVDGRWWITDSSAGTRHGSAADDDPSRPEDTAYVSRRNVGGRVIVHIAGIHAIGSLGAAHYLSGQLSDLFAAHGETDLSFAVRCTYDGLTITKSEVIAGPYCW